MDPNMDLNLAKRAMIVAMKTAHPEMGKKKLTTEVNKLLPAKMQVEKCKLRDFLRSRDESANAPIAATKPRGKTFDTGTAYPLFHLLREAEREYLLNLDNASATRINPDHSESGRCHPVAHVRHHLVVLLVLLGFRPCHPFVSPKTEGIATMGEMVLRCLIPLMEKFDLESYGFKLLYTIVEYHGPETLIHLTDVATEVKTHDKRFRGFEGTWVLADTQSPGWGAVHAIFVAMPTVRIAPQLMCMALGFPAQDKNQDGNDDFYNKIEILDATEHALLKDHFSQHTCKVGVVKIFCGQGGTADWERLAEYYMACKDLATMLGTELTLDLCHHPRMRVWCCLTGRVGSSQSVIGE